MATIAPTDRELPIGTVLEARYKGQTYEATIVAEGDEKRYRLDDGSGRSYKSPSSAGSALRDGKATNGWAFWHVKGSAPTSDPEGPADPGEDVPEGEPAGPAAPEAPETPDEPEGDEVADPEKELVTATAPARRSRGRRADVPVFECGECSFRADSQEALVTHFEAEHSAAA